MRHGLLTYRKPKLHLLGCAIDATCKDGSSATGAGNAAGNWCMDGLSNNDGCGSGAGAISQQTGCWTGGTPWEFMHACVDGSKDDGDYVGNSGSAGSTCVTGNAYNVAVGFPCSSGPGAS